MSIKSGRSEFEVRLKDRDYSGLSIEDKFLSDRDIERSFFNGVNLVNCAFDGVKMNNTGVFGGDGSPLLVGKYGSFRIGLCRFPF